MAIIVITGHSSLPDKDASGKTVIDTLITYRDEGNQSHAVVIKKENPTKDEIQKAIQSDVTKRSQIVGTQFNV